VLTIDKDQKGAEARRSQAIDHIPRGSQIGEPWADRDEYPPARSYEGGTGASVKYVPYWDNQGSGVSLGNQARNLNDGDKYIIVETD
jgi:hypothetical protein